MRILSGQSSVKTVITAILAAFIIAGCAAQGTRYLTVEKMTPPKNTYQHTLFQQYLDMAREQAARADYADSDAFARRAAAVVDGMTVLPEEISARKLPEKSVKLLTAARKRLMRAFEHPDGRARVPYALATAQTQFDCWMEKQEENINPDEIVVCRSQFFAALSSVECDLFPSFGRREWVIYFSGKKDSLDDTAFTTIAVIQQLAKIYEDTTFIIHAHADDMAGGYDSNQQLSQRRADTVINALVDGGLHENRIVTVKSWGKGRPATMTEDGTSRPENDRVTVLMADPME
ncbi:MAG: OmpA family protein [Alphaproteobacteria bacterium]|nr:MAG: OmpA family protein [Alphaproteobacteria bacterium]